MQDGAHPRTILLPRRAFLSTLVTLLAALIGLPVLAEHIGPHRTVSTFKWERLACHYKAVYDPAGPGFFACTLDLYEPPDGSCPAEGSVADYFNPAACVGWPGSCTTLPCDISLDDSIRSCSEGQPGCRAVEKTSQLPPATVSGSLSCAAPGSGGWCRGGAELSLSGSEPLDGETILSIEGTRNGETFACSGAACGVPLLEGANSFTFWARSSYGDTSEMGTAAGKLDSAAPALSGEISGSSGEAGWFVSEATVTASASDPAPGSGLASLEVAVDSGGWAAYSGPLVLGDGEHTVDFRAADIAGNTAQSTQSVRVDTLPPEISLSAGDSFCPGCGQTLEIVLSVADAGSGVVEWTLTADGVGVASGGGPASQTLAWDGFGLGGGSHSLTLEARDAAGNTSTASTSFDLIVPTPKPDPPTDEPEEEAPPPPSAGAAPTTAPSPTPDPATTSAPDPAASSADPTSTPLSVPFAGLPAAPDPLPEEGPPASDLAGPQGEVTSVSADGSSGPLFGAAALALIAAASAVGLDRLRRRQKEQDALRQEMAERNKAAEAREVTQRASSAAAAAAAGGAVLVDELPGSTAEQILERIKDRLDTDLQSPPHAPPHVHEIEGRTLFAYPPQADSSDQATEVDDSGSPAIPWSRSELPDDLFRLFPRFSFIPGSTRQPIVNIGIFKVGSHHSWGPVTEGASHVGATPQNFTHTFGNVAVSGGWEGDSAGISVRSQPIETELAGGDLAVSESQSGSIRIRWNGWRTTLTAQYNSVNISVNSSGDLPYSARGSQGLYVEQRPVQTLAAVAITVVTIGTAVVAGPPAAQRIGQWLQGLRGPILVPGG